MDKILILLICSAVYMTAGAAMASSQQDPAADEHEKPILVAPKLDEVLSQVRRSFSGLNFEATFVLVKGRFAEPYNWMHGIYQGGKLNIFALKTAIAMKLSAKTI